MYLHPYPLDLHPPLHALLSHHTHSEPTQVPFSLALCPRPTQPSDLVATGPLPWPPLHALTPHLLTHCPTLPLAFLPLQSTTTTPHPPKKTDKILLKFAVHVHWMLTWYFGYTCTCCWRIGFQQGLMRLVQMSGHRGKSALIFASTSSTLPPNLFISICFCLICPSHPFSPSSSAWHLTRSVSQSPWLTSVDVSPGKSLAVCFCLLLCCFSLCAFPLPCEKLLRAFVMSSSHFHGDQH